MTRVKQTARKSTGGKALPARKNTKKDELNPVQKIVQSKKRSREDTDEVSEMKPPEQIKDEPDDPLNENTVEQLKERAIAKIKEMEPEELREFLKKKPKRDVNQEDVRKDTKFVKKENNEQPKRPMSAFVLFGQDNRDRIRKENPAATFGDFGKLLGAEWAKASDSQKRKYIALYDQSKKEYDKKMSEYQENNDKDEYESPNKE